MSIALGPQVCGALDESSQREWLVADGVGGYAMGTVSGLRTRRYHGLLAVAVDGPGSRMLGLVALDPVLVVGDARFRLATHEWAGGAVDPHGHELLSTFELDRGLPRWRWQIGDIVLERELALTYGRPAVGVVHRLVRTDRPVRLELTPLCTWRSVHGERFANGAPNVEHTAEGFVFESAYRLAGAGWAPGGDWYRGIRAREEAARGLGDVEDVWAAGAFAVELNAGESHEVTAAAAPFDGTLPQAKEIVAAARSRADSVLRRAAPTDALDEQLVLAADQFTITTAGRPTAVAGYPWFGEWSRDLMTSYEGLYLATNRHDEGREVLRTSAATVSEGMLANTADTGSLEYNTVDGTLWFVHAVGRHLAVTGDDGLGRELAPVLAEIVQHHVDGTRYGIGVDPTDGLLRQGADGWALTWMDARIDGVPVTQRAGKPVEVNALWLRALEVAASCADPDQAQRWTAAAGARRRVVPVEIRARRRQRPARRRRRAGRRRLVGAAESAARRLARSARRRRCPQHGRRVPQRAADAARAALAGTERPTLPTTPPRQPGRARRRVPPGNRVALADRPVRRRLPGDGRRAPRRARGARGAPRRMGLGSVSETADGAAPHTATGCPFQAWSVAELLRVRRLAARGRRGAGGRAVARPPQHLARLISVPRYGSIVSA